MKRIVLSSAILIFLLLTVSPGSAGKPQEKSLEAIEILSGLSSGELRKKDDYQLIPLIIALDFNLKPLTERFYFEPAQLIQFQIEPFISPVFSPNKNIEAGTAFALKLGLFPQNWKLQPYVKTGAGFVYITQHTLEQGTQFNFIEYGGTGIHYFVFKNTALTFEYRFRHLSNADIKDPNAGINSYLILGGICYRF
jgi:hypothetical protein